MLAGTMGLVTVGAKGAASSPRGRNGEQRAAVEPPPLRSPPPPPRRVVVAAAVRVLIPLGVDAALVGKRV